MAKFLSCYPMASTILKITLVMIVACTDQSSFTEKQRRSNLEVPKQQEVQRTAGNKGNPVDIADSWNDASIPPPEEGTPTEDAATSIDSKPETPLADEAMDDGSKPPVSPPVGAKSAQPASPPNPPNATGGEAALPPVSVGGAFLAMTCGFVFPDPDQAAQVAISCLLKKESRATRLTELVELPAVSNLEVLAYDQAGTIERLTPKSLAPHNPDSFIIVPKGRPHRIEVLDKQSQQVVAQAVITGTPNTKAYTVTGTIDRRLLSSPHNLPDQTCQESKPKADTGVLTDIELEFAAPTTLIVDVLGFCGVDKGNPRSLMLFYDGAGWSKGYQLHETSGSELTTHSEVVYRRRFPAGQIKMRIASGYLIDTNPQNHATRDEFYLKSLRFSADQPFKITSGFQEGELEASRVVLP